MDYAAGLILEIASSQSRKKLILVISLVSNVGILGLFKYFNFISAQLGDLLSTLGAQVHSPRLSWVLPIGLSFHTFQSMSYTIDVYRGHVKSVADFPLFAAFLSFFPQLVAGPIERTHQMMPQFSTPREWDPAAFQRTDVRPSHFVSPQPWWEA